MYVRTVLFKIMHGNNCDAENKVSEVQHICWVMNECKQYTDAQKISFKTK